MERRGIHSVDYIGNHSGAVWLRWLLPAAPWLAALVLTVVWFPTVGTTDVVDRLTWMGDIAARGVRDAFRTSYAQYPPLSFALLALPTAAAGAFGLAPVVAYKASLVVGLALTGGVLALWTRRVAVAGAMTLALTPGTVALGYNDVYYLPLLLLALWALERRRFGAFAALVAAAALVKWQPLALAPALLLYVLSEMRRGETGHILWRRFVRAMLPGVAVAAATLLVFGRETINALRRAGSDPYLSGNALNANWPLGLLLRAWQPEKYATDPLPYVQYVVVTDRWLLLLPKLVCAAAYLWVLYRFWRGPRTVTDALFAALLAYLAYFLFNTGVHENHSTPAVALAGVLWAKEGRFGWLFVALAVATNLNLWLFYGFDGGNRTPPALVTVSLALLYVASGVALLVRGVALFPVRRRYTGGEEVRTDERGTESGGS